MEEKPRETTVEFLASLAAVLVTGLFIITFVVQAFEIPSSSMEEYAADRRPRVREPHSVRAENVVDGPLLPYREVRRGDIVVFLHPDAAYPGTYVVKRIMGVPGDRIHLRNGVVYRNGEALSEPYVDHDRDEPIRFLPQQFSRRASGRLECLPEVAGGAGFACSGRTTWWCLPGIISPWATIGA